MRTHLLLAAAVVATATLHPAASSAVPHVKGVVRAPGLLDTASTSIGSSGPLTGIALGDDLSCQVGYNGNNQLFYESFVPADCGTFLGVGGTLYAPDFANHAGTATGAIGTPFTPVSQTASSGSGSIDDPYTVTTVVDAGSTGMRITQVDSYVTGRNYYRSDIVVTNNSSSAKTAMLSRAADCYFEGRDNGKGAGLYNTATHTALAGCISPTTGRSMRLISQTPGNTSSLNSWYEAFYGDVWSAVANTADGVTPLPNTCNCADDIDNGMAVAWQITNLPAHGSVIKTVLHEFLDARIKLPVDFLPYCTVRVGTLAAASPRPALDCDAAPARLACTAAFAPAATAGTPADASSTPAIAACAVAVAGVANCVVVTGPPPAYSCSAPLVSRAQKEVRRS